MSTHKYLLALLLGVFSLGSIYGTAEYPELCPTEKTCKNMKKRRGCQCYCSVKCGPRRKEKGDNPVWAGKDDPNKQYCYCKQRDQDDYEANCADMEEQK